MGFVGVVSHVEVTDRNVRERFGAADEVDKTTPASSLSATTETEKILSLDDGAFGSSVRGTVGRLTGFDFGGRRVRFDSPVRCYKTLA